MTILLAATRCTYSGSSSHVTYCAAATSPQIMRDTAVFVQRNCSFCGVTVADIKVFTVFTHTLRLQFREFGGPLYARARAHQIS